MRRAEQAGGPVLRGFELRCGARESGRRRGDHNAKPPAATWQATRRGIWRRRMSLYACAWAAEFPAQAACCGLRTDRQTEPVVVWMDAPPEEWVCH